MSDTSCFVLCSKEHNSHLQVPGLVQFFTVQQRKVRFWSSSLSIPFCVSTVDVNGCKLLQKTHFRCESICICISLIINFLFCQLKKILKLKVLVFCLYLQNMLFYGVCFYLLRTTFSATVQQTNVKNKIVVLNLIQICWLKV